MPSRARRPGCSATPTASRERGCDPALRGSSGTRPYDAPMLTYVFAAVALGLLIALVVLGIVLHVLVTLHREERDSDRTYYAHERDARTAEYRELLNRVQ